MQKEKGYQGPEQEVCMRACFQEAFRQVSPQAQRCLALACFEGYSSQEIASRLHISQGTVTSYISRGREQLRQAYRQAIENDRLERGEEQGHE